MCRCDNQMPIADFPFDDAIGKIDFVRRSRNNVLQFDDFSCDCFCFEISAHFLLFNDVRKHQRARAAASHNLCSVFWPTDAVNRSDCRRTEFRIAVRPL